MYKILFCLSLCFFFSEALFSQGDQFLNSIEKEAYDKNTRDGESLPKPLSLTSLVDALEGRKISVESQIEFDRLITTLGEDNLRGYVALINCDHDRAIALFEVGQLSFHFEQKLAGVWMQCIAEQERKNSTKAGSLYRLITEMDPSIQNPQMASMLVDRYISNLKNERALNGLARCTPTGGSR